MRRTLCSAILALLLVPCSARQAADVARLVQDPAVKAALDAAKANEPSILDAQIRLAEIPAPPFKEEKKAAVVKEIFSTLGLDNVRIDTAGNVIGERPGAAPRPNLVLSAHMDTVFPEGTDVKTTRSGALIKGPGIADDNRGLAVLIGVARALDQGRVRTLGTITFVGTVGEEGLGDLRGAKALLRDTLKDKVDFFVSVDGSGLGITNGGVGSYRYRVTYKGPGGHSYGAFGLPNPVHALGRAIAKISDFQVPGAPKTTFNVGRIGGGTSVNSIAYESWMEIDMRSVTMDALDAIDARFHEAVEAALREENARWGGKVRLTVDRVRIGARPAGSTPEASPIVQAAFAVSRALGLSPPRLGSASTDANAAISLGIPAITIGGGGSAAGGHSPSESFDATDSWQGTQRAVLLAVALAGSSG